MDVGTPEELHHWMRRLAEDPANAGHPLLAEFRALAERHDALLRQLRHDTQEPADQQRQFAQMVNHEFRTPLAIIDSASQLLELEPRLPVVALARVVKIRNAVQRMCHLFDRCLTGERADGASRVVAFDLTALLDGLVAGLRLDDPTRHFDLRGFEQAALVPGDRDLMTVVFANLLENALRYSPSDGPVRVVLVPEDGRVLVRVEDEGIGMNVADAARIFDKYFRASNAAGTTGAGLGLHRARCIVESHGGGIAVASEPGLGSVFTVSLPAAGPPPG